MLRDSVVVVVRTRPRAIPLAMINQLMGFLLFPIYGLLMGLRLATQLRYFKQIQKEKDQVNIQFLFSFVSLVYLHS